jgi:hypothetical protein
MPIGAPITFFFVFYRPGTGFLLTKPGQYRPVDIAILITNSANLS